MTGKTTFFNLLFSGVFLLGVGGSGPVIAENETDDDFGHSSQVDVSTGFSSMNSKSASRYSPSTNAAANSNANTNKARSTNIIQSAGSTTTPELYQSPLLAQLPLPRQTSDNSDGFKPVVAEYAPQYGVHPPSPYTQYYSSRQNTSSTQNLQNLPSAHSVRSIPGLQTVSPVPSSYGNHPGYVSYPAQSNQFYQASQPVNSVQQNRALPQFEEDPTIRTVPPVPTRAPESSKAANVAEDVGSETAKKKDDSSKSIDFDGMYQSVKDKSAKAAEATRNWFQTTFSDDDESEDAHNPGQGAAKNEAKSRDTIYRQAVDAEREGRFADAETGYREYIHLLGRNSGKKSSGNWGKRTQVDPRDVANVYHRLAVVCWRQGKTERVETFFRHALNVSPKDNEALAADYGLFLLENEKYDQSEIVIRNALIAAPNNRRLTRILARSLALQNRPVEAIRHLSTVMDEATARTEIAAIYRQKGDEHYAVMIEGQPAETANPSVNPASPAKRKNRALFVDEQAKGSGKSNTARVYPVPLPLPPKGRMRDNAGDANADSENSRSRVYHYSGTPRPQAHYFISAAEEESVPISYVDPH